MVSCGHWEEMETLWNTGQEIRMRVHTWPKPARWPHISREGGSHHPQRHLGGRSRIAAPRNMYIPVLCEKIIKVTPVWSGIFFSIKLYFSFFSCFPVSVKNASCRIHVLKLCSKAGCLFSSSLPPLPLSLPLPSSLSLFISPFLFKLASPSVQATFF